MNLLLKLAVDLVQHFEANQLIANDKFVSVLQERAIDRLAIKQRAVGRLEIAQTITRLTGAIVTFSVDAGMQA